MRVLITGAAGQDGTILATTLMRDGAEILGLVKPGTEFHRLRSYVPSIEIAEIDLADTTRLRDCVDEFEPTHIYNLGGFTAPGESWDHAEEVHQINVESVDAMLHAARELTRQARFFQASSSHIFEGTDRSPQDEGFELSPASPYAKSKAAALVLVREARKSHGLFAVSGILYNHESPLRGENFVTRKISRAVARISLGLQDKLTLGDIEVARDWGWAPDYVRGMRLILEAHSPADYVLATGISHRLSFFVQRAFRAAGISNWRDYVETAQSDRPVDTNKMVGNPRRAYLELGWRHTVDFDAMAAIMVEHDLRELREPGALWPIP